MQNDTKMEYKPRVINYDRDWFNMSGRHGLDNRISDIKAFFSKPLKGMSALDIGCAEGEILCWLSTYFDSITGYEKSEKLTNTAKNLTESMDNISIRQFDIAEEDIGQQYDYTFLLGVLHYFEDDATRKKVAEKVFKATSKMLFIRTAFIENRRADNTSQEVLNRFIHLTYLIDLAKQYNFRWILIDNTYRGKNERRLGDLFVARKICPEDDSIFLNDIAI